MTHSQVKSPAFSLGHQALVSVSLIDNQLIPMQQPTPLKLTKSTDYYEQRCVKYPYRAHFHSYAEFIHALLLEADGQVTSFVPQPFCLHVGRRLFTPDVYIGYRDQQVVRELSAVGRLSSDAWLHALEGFFQHHAMRFEVVSNESVLEREALALNWLPIIQILSEAQFDGIKTTFEETQILSQMIERRNLTVGDLLTEGPRDSRYREELALVRLVHQHRITVDYDTVLQL